MATGERTASDVVVRPLRESELRSADEVMRVAFGTFLGVPEPRTFMGDAAFVQSRWRSNPAAAFAAEANGTLVGSNFATRWGSFGFFGPLTVRPDFWDRGVGKRLLEPIMACFESWRIRHAGLFTFAHSQKHVGLYQRFGFWPRFLTAIMAKPLASGPPATPEPPATSDWSGFSRMPLEQQPDLLHACREVSDAVYDGLDLSEEIKAVAAFGLGETALLWVGGRLAGFAVCHFGAGTEGGSGRCYMKFAAVRPGASAVGNFAKLLSACEALAREYRLSALVGGTNLARTEAYRAMREHGFTTSMQGVAMQRPNEEGYNRAGSLVIDDWR
jgi:GNAT superfamily N-acetyltransferase